MSQCPKCDHCFCIDCQKAIPMHQHRCTPCMDKFENGILDDMRAKEKMPARIVVKAVADEDGHLDNMNIVALVEIDGMQYPLEPNTLDVKVPTADKVTVSMEADIVELELDMMATVIPPDGFGPYEGRVRIAGRREPMDDGALHTSSDITDCTIDGKDALIREVRFKAAGNDQSNALIVKLTK